MEKKLAVMAAFCLAGAVAASGRAAEVTLTPSFAFRQEYNDNLFFDYQKEIIDVVATASPGIRMRYRSERMTAELGARLDGFFHRDNHEQNSVDQQYSGSLRRALTERATASADAKLKIDSRPDRDLEAGGLVQGSETRSVWDLGVGFDYQLSEISTLGLAYRYGRTEYDDPGQADYRTDILALSWRRDLSKLLPRTVGRSSLQFTGYDMDTNQTRSYAWSLGAEHTLSERWQLFGDLGGRWTETEFQTQRLVEVAPGLWALQLTTVRDDNPGVTGEFGAGYKGEHSDGSLALRHGLEAASGRSGSVERTGLRGDWGYRLAERSWLRLRGETFMNRSHGEELAAVAIDERTLRARVSWQHGFNDEFTLEAAYDFTRTEDLEADTERNRNLVWIRLLYNYGLTL